MQQYQLCVFLKNVFYNKPFYEGLFFCVCKTDRHPVRPFIWQNLIIIQRWQIWRPSLSPQLPWQHIGTLVLHFLPFYIDTGNFFLYSLKLHSAALYCLSQITMRILLLPATICSTIFLPLVLPFLLSYHGTYLNFSPGVNKLQRPKLKSQENEVLQAKYITESSSLHVPKIFSSLGGVIR